MARPTLSVHLLGGFSVAVDGRPVRETAWERRSAQDLVKLLALAARHRLTRDQVADVLWPALADEAGATNTRRAAHFARRALGEEKSVVLSEGWVELAPEWDVVTDVEAFESAARQAARTADRSAFERAADVYPGDLLPDDRYQDWCAADRDRLSRTYLEVLAGAQRWEDLVAADPENEPAHREIMRAHLAAGDRGGALRQFEELRGALREVGLTPDEASVAVYEDALAPAGTDAPTPQERARALLAWGVVHWERTDLGEAHRAATEVKALAIDAGLGREYVEAAQMLGLVAYAQGAWREHFGQAVVEAIRRTPEMAPFVFDAHMCMSEFSLHERDGTTAALRLSEQILSAAEQIGSVVGRGLALLLRGEAQLLDGEDPDDVRGVLAEAVRLHEKAGQASGFSIATERLAEVMDRLDDRDSAQRLHARALDLAHASPMTGHLVPFVYGGMIEAAPPDDVPHLLDAAAAASSGLTICETCSMALHVHAIPALARQGDLDGAREHLATAERIATRWSDGDWAAAVVEARDAVRRAEST